MTILVTGGAGFIGSNFVLDWLSSGEEKIIVLDKLTYAGNLQNLKSHLSDSRLIFVHGDMGDTALVESVLAKHQPRALLNFAAESHVDRSIEGPAEFIQTNIVSTFNFIEASRAYWGKLPEDRKAAFRFLHVSTDEVYGSLSPDAPAFTEDNKYMPNSPYSASKAASDHLVRAAHHTYGLPVITTNCSNNYGPYQFPEKLIPLMITRAIGGGELPVYGDGMNIRDWLYVSDHCLAIQRVLEEGRIGETYNIGGNSEKNNLEVVHILCDILDRELPKKDNTSYRTQIKFVTDRLGHDRRYAVNSGKIERELGWKPQESFETGILKTVRWYLAHQHWIADINSGFYREIN